jgi:hypothetical protein
MLCHLVLSFISSLPSLTCVCLLRDCVMNAHLPNNHFFQSHDSDQYDLQYSLSPEQSQESCNIFLGLPTASLENLPEIKSKLVTCFNAQKEMFASIILDQVTSPHTSLDLTLSLPLSPSLHTHTQDGQYLRVLLSLSKESEDAGRFQYCGMFVLSSLHPWFTCGLELLRSLKQLSF